MATKVGGPIPLNYERFYSNFQSPPLAPVYRPTLDEFSDPISYVAKIRPEAEKYGVVKIVPPEGFKPTFAIESGKFRFTPRIQRINEVEGLFRERACFIDRIARYWHLQARPLRIPQLDGRVVDVYKAYLAVAAEGGAENATKNKRWTVIGKALGIKSNQGPSKLKDFYKRWIEPFVQDVQRDENEWSVKKEEVDFEEDVKPEKVETSPRGLGEGRSSMQGGSRMSMKSTRGHDNNQNVDKKKEVKKVKGSVDKLASVVCMFCGSGAKEKELIMCDAAGCTRCVHFGCSRPPFVSLPKDDYFCPVCTMEEVRKVGIVDGFYDSEREFSLDEFSKFANDFKQDYFGKPPKEVPLELLEKEFWRKIIDQATPLSVMYGADLITSRMGSGFVRKTDQKVNPGDRAMAAHPWNLNNMPVLKDSVLTHFDSGISGMMVPWVYVGMCFSTFCWHTEDHWTYSVNYNHWGERKIWYGISGDEAEKFEKVVAEVCPSLIRHQPDLLHHMTTAFNPQLLRLRGVNVTTVHQNAGEFVITFPRAYHAGFNEGLNFAEAVNFAPIDWLSRGRECMSAYAMVRRSCVFAHDELVMKMVSACGKLSISMAVAALDELKSIIVAESKMRKDLGDKGVRNNAKIEFEAIADDARSCRVCNTTVYMSALVCAHNRRVCLDHWSLVCPRCPPHECHLQYRFSMDELIPLVEKLKERTKTHDEWEEAVENIIDVKSEKHKPDLRLVERLLDTARTQHYPHSPALAALVELHGQCINLVTEARNLLGGRIRVRSKTRIQRADTRKNLEEVKRMRIMLTELPVDCKDLLKEIDAVIAKVEEWEKRAREALAQEYSVENVTKLLEEAEIIDVRLDLTYKLERLHEAEEWSRDRADPFLSWRAAEGMENGEDFVCRHRWPLEDLEELIGEGMRLGMGGSPRMRKLDVMKNHAIEYDTKATNLFYSKSSISEKSVMELWKGARDSDWCTAPGMDQLRLEVDSLFCFHRYDKSEDTTWTDLVHSLDACEKSRALNHSDAMKKVAELIVEMETFTKKLIALFLPKQSYFSLFEIIAFREDLVPIAEGQQTAIQIEQAQLNDHWAPLDQFDSRAALHEHINNVFSQQDLFLARVRSSNETLPSYRTCPCVREKEGDVLICLVCHSKTHDGCAWWSPFLEHLPPGSYLCVRCLRGKRPILEDVKAALINKPKRSLEAAMVSYVVDGVAEVTKKTRTALEKWRIAPSAENTTRLQQATMTMLAMECFDSSLLDQLSQPISAVFRDLLHSQIQTWQRLRGQPVSSNLPVQLFAPKKARYSGDCKRRGKSRVIEDEGKGCAHPRCLMPYARNLMWVQCERCKMWYHIICTGQVLDPDDLNYECEPCVGVKKR